MSESQTPYVEFTLPRSAQHLQIERLVKALEQLVKSVDSIAQELQSVQVIPPVIQPQTPKRSKFFWRLRHRTS